MTDPRIAALAEALLSQPLDYDPVGMSDGYRREYAVAILAALEAAGWQLHPHGVAFTDTVGEIADLTARLEAADSQTDRQAAEIARLRRIEEAARLLMYMHEQMGPQFIPHDEIDLRAALEEKP